MSREGAPCDIDLISIDVDGNDWHIWNAIVKYRPRVVLVEFNPCIPNDVYFVQDADSTLNHGNSLLSLIELGKQKGYSLVCVQQIDAFFILNEYYELFNIPDNHIDAMNFAGNHQTIIFQGYDGTLFTAGCQKLLWSNREFTFDQLQVLPASERRFGDRVV